MLYMYMEKSSLLLHRSFCTLVGCNCALYPEQLPTKCIQYFFSMYMVQTLNTFVIEIRFSFTGIHFTVCCQSTFVAVASGNFVKYKMYEEFGLPLYMQNLYESPNLPLFAICIHLHFI
jgi:hypothetical protein